MKAMTEAEEKSAALREEPTRAIADLKASTPRCLKLINSRRDEKNAG